MARSTYIYLFVDANHSDVLAAFTVRHEAAWWFRHKFDQKTSVLLLRMRDGGGDDQPQEMEIPYCDCRRCIP